MNVVRKGALGGTRLAVGGRVTHDLDLDTEGTLAEENVTGGDVNEVANGLTGVDHETVLELHGLGTGSTELTRDNDLNTLSTGLHDEADDTVGGTADSQTVEELVTKGLALGDGGKTTLGDTLGVDGDLARADVETLLNEGGQLTNAATVLTKNGLGVSGTNNDFGLNGGLADLNARVSFLSKLTLEELIKLSVEDTVSDDLAFLRDVRRHFDETGQPLGP